MGKNSDRELQELRNLVHEIGRYRQPPDWALKECRRIYREHERKQREARDPAMGRILDDICFKKISFWNDNQVEPIERTSGRLRLAKRKLSQLVVRPVTDRKARRAAICQIKNINDTEIEPSVDRQVARAWNRDKNAAKLSKYKSVCRDEDMTDTSVSIFRHMGLPETKRVDRCLALHASRWAKQVKK